MRVPRTEASRASKRLSFMKTTTIASVGADEKEVGRHSARADLDGNGVAEWWSNGKSLLRQHHPNLLHHSVNPLVPWDSARTEWRALPA